MIQERILKLVNEYCGGVKSSFAHKIGVSPSVIENILGIRKGNPSFEVLVKILTSFPDVDANWLILGINNQSSKSASINVLERFFCKYELDIPAVSKILDEDYKTTEEYIKGRLFEREEAEKWGDVFGLNPLWLMSGEGDMFQNDLQKTIFKDKNPENYVCDNSSPYDPGNNNADVKNIIVNKLVVSNKLLAETVHKLIDQCRKNQENG